MNVFVDTSAFYAVLDADDEHHPSARDAWSESVETRMGCTRATMSSSRRSHCLKPGSGYSVRAFTADALPVLTVFWVDEVVHQSAHHVLWVRAGGAVSCRPREFRGPATPPSRTMPFVLTCISRSKGCGSFRGRAADGPRHASGRVLVRPTRSCLPRAAGASTCWRPSRHRGRANVSHNPRWILPHEIPAGQLTWRSCAVPRVGLEVVELITSVAFQQR